MRLTFDHALQDPLEKAVERSWHLRYIILLWLSHLLLTPFDLSTISSSVGESPSAPSDMDAFVPSSDTPFPEKLCQLPQLCKTLLLLATKVLSSPLPRESDAAALLIVRMSIRKDMLELGVLEAVVEWCLRCWSDERTGEDIDLLLAEDNSLNPHFIRTGALKVLAGLLTQAESMWVKLHIPKIWGLVTSMEDKSSVGTDAEGSTQDEWSLAGVRKVATKIYRWVGILQLTSGAGDEEEIVEDIVGRLLNLLGDRDTNVRLAASKSLGVLTSKLPPEMANEVVNAVVGGYDEDVLYEYDEEPLCNGQSITSIFGDAPDPGPKKKELLVSISPEKWHGLTLTLATFLRQRAIKPHTAGEGDDEESESTTPLFQIIIHRILTALTFDQRRTTFSLGSNVRDAACYAAWALARSYYTKELLIIPIPPEYAAYPDREHVTENIIQLLATNLITTACMDPVGNIRRAASAALQELVGRHPNVVIEGIPVVQAVDYSAVAARRRAVTKVAKATAGLDVGYWFALARWGMVDGWRGIGGGDSEGRRITGKGLGVLVDVAMADEKDNVKRLERSRRLVGWILSRAAQEARKDVEVRHGVFHALAEVLEGLYELERTTVPTLKPLQQELISDVFHYLQGKDLTNLNLRPALTAEACCRLVSAICNVSLDNKHPTLLTPPLSLPLQRSCLAIVEASLDNRPEDPVMEQAIPAAKDLFRILDAKNGANMVEGWCRRVLAAGLTTRAQVETGTAGQGGGSGLGRKRGLVGGLGEVLSVLVEDGDIDEERETVIRDVVDVLVNACTRQGDVEMRVAGIRAITRGFMSTTGAKVDIGKYPGVILALYEALDDYAVDSRGDVGSWVRADGISAVSEGWKSGVLRFGITISPDSRDAMEGLVIRLVRLSVEKLDKLRTRAFDALKIILYHPQESTVPQQNPDVPSSIKDIGSSIDFSLPADTYLTPTTASYFSALLPLLSVPIPALTEAFLSGYVISSGSGSDSLLRSSCSALWFYLDSVPTPVLTRVSHSLVQVLESSPDRGIAPCLETIGAGFESCVLARTVAVSPEWGKKVFMATQKVQKGAGSVGRLIGAVRVYRGLGLAAVAASWGKTVGLVVRKLVAMLAHPFPLVRREVVEALYLVVTVGGVGGVLGEEGKEWEQAWEVLMETDWMGKMDTVKAGIGKLKKVLVRT